MHATTPYLSQQRDYLIMAVHSGGGARGAAAPPQKNSKSICFPIEDILKKLFKRGFAPPLKMFCVRPCTSLQEITVKCTALDSKNLCCTSQQTLANSIQDTCTFFKDHVIIMTLEIHNSLISNLEVVSVNANKRGDKADILSRAQQHAIGNYNSGGNS